MEQRRELICGVPALVLGAPAQRVFFYVHGKMGNKEEALDFAAVADAQGWQVVAIDLPQHGQRKSAPEPFTTGQILPELQAVYQALRTRWNEIGVYATSMGAWFSMRALPGAELNRCLFASPVVDLRQMLEKNMAWNSVTPEQLEREGEVRGEKGDAFSWREYAYAKAHPITEWTPPTTICFGELDHLTDLDTIHAFVQRFQCQLCLRKGGRHWFHTQEDARIMRAWEREFLRGF